MRLVEALAKDHSLASFKKLLTFLGDTNEDVRYAAAESVQARGDRQYDQELIISIGRIPMDERWPVYRAARSYPTARMMRFLLSCMKAETNYWQSRRHFDERNCFYLAGSLQLLAKAVLKADIAMPALEDRHLEGYKRFLAKAENLIENHENANRRNIQGQ